jgi:N-acetylglucosaminyldiphosphoundecaprenol N-acetyl-beta-D-mannosaminyltransferase
MDAKAGLEWFYRFIQEPGRMWKRYLVGNSRFIWLVFRERMQERRE